MNNCPKIQFVLFLFLLGFAPLSHSQIKRSTLSIGGSSNVLNIDGKPIYFSQTIGQQGAIGSYFANGQGIRQGFQQPPITIVPLETTPFTLDALVFPNPVQSSVTISFNETVINTIHIQLYDINGRLVVDQIKEPSQTVTLDMSFFSSGTYLLKATHENQQLSTKLVKK